MLKQQQQSTIDDDKVFELPSQNSISMTQSNRKNDNSSNCIYLNPDDWSPRYDATCFYTVQLNGYIWVTSNEQFHDLVPHPQEHERQELQDKDQIYGTHVEIPVKCRLSTYYYKIIMYRGHDQHVIYRSYRQFEWLYKQLRRTMSQQQQSPEKSSIEPIITIPHPLQGKGSHMECQFFGYCWGVRQIQEWLDYIGQQQQQQQRQQRQHQSTTTTTNPSNLVNESNYHSKFAETRCQQLSYFLSTVLEQHGPLSASYSALCQFLEL